jgi:hypothetical protein
MITIDDDVPHPIPPIAYLRYKENWFFIIMDVKSSVYGMAHFNYEPGHDRARMSCNLIVRGEPFKYSNQIAFPQNFAYSKEIGDGVLKVRFVEAHTRIEMQLDSADVALNLAFVKHAPAFDFENYNAANPDKPSAREIVSIATNQMYHHYQQAMTITGAIEVKSGRASGETIQINGLGYRDHSRGMRMDHIMFKHTWSFLYFPSAVFGAKSLTSLLRKEISATSGYVCDGDGMRSLGDMEITSHGSIGGNMPATVEYRLHDAHGKKFTIVADIEHRMGYVPLVTEAAGSGGHFYEMFENFCPITLKETGEKGYALVEIGFQSQ